MRKFIVVAVALLGTATMASALNSPCQSWGCGTNGTQLNGIQIEEARAGSVVTVVTLPSDAAALLGTATAASVIGEQCPEAGCGANGTQLDGLKIEDARAGGVLAVVTLPSGEVLAFDADAATLESAAPRLNSQCQSWGCGANGTQLDGIEINDARASGVVAAVTLPSGEVLELGVR